MSKTTYNPDLPDISENFLINQKEVLPKLLNNINALVCIINIRRGTILWVNHYGQSKLGCSLEYISKMPPEEILSLIHPDFRININQSLLNLCRHKQENHYHILKVRNKSGKWHWVLLSCETFEKNHKGNVHTILLFGMDININKAHDHLQRIMKINNSDNPIFVTNIITKREKEIAQHISNGKTDKEIAQELQISIHTVKTHRKRIIHKLGLKNSKTLIKFIAENGLQ